MSAFHNNSLIGAGGQQAFQITRSLRFRRNASAYFTRTPASAGNRTTWTWSGWVKRGSLSVSDTGGVIGLFGAGTLGSSQSNFFFYFNSDNTIYLQETVNNVSNQLIYTTTPVFRDPSAWYHIIIAMDTTQATASNRTRVYVNGSLIAGTFSVTPSQNQALSMNNNVPQYIGGASVNPQAYGNVLSYFDGYMAELNFVEGYPTVAGTTYDATSWAALNVATLFGQTNSITGVWGPKLYSGTYGTNGYYLKFADNSSSLTTTIGKDSSVNGNNWTPNAGISVAPGVTYDSMLDTPTPYNDGGQGRGNYCTLNPVSKGLQFPSMAEGSLRTGDTNVGNYHQTVGGTIGVDTGKWYWEITLNGTTYNSRSLGIASGQITTASDNAMWNSTTSLRNYRALLIANSTTVTPCRAIDGTVTTATNITLPSTLTGTSVFMVAMDVTAGAIWFGLDGTWLKSATTAEIIAGTTTNAVYTDIGSPSNPWTPAVYNYLGASSGYGWFANFGQRPFSYTPPTGFKALNTQNLPEPAILNGANYMAATTYTGTGSALSVSNAVNGISFQPDWVWIKGRSVAYEHAIFDVVRGVRNVVRSNGTNAEVTETAGTSLTAFDSGGFSLGTNGGAASTNVNGSTFVAWQWDAGGSTVTNTNGSISSQVRANPTAGFSIVTYTGTGSAATIGHGLGVAPRMIIIFERSPGGDDHIVYHASLTSNQYSIRLNTTAAQVGPSGNYWNSTSPTSSVFSVGTSLESNQSTATYVAYCFAAVAGYSAFGTYIGNASSTDGAFVYTGFRPRFVMCKRIDSTSHWPMLDSSRAGYNNANNDLYASLSQGEATSAFIDILSNGFKVHATSGEINGNGGTYMYMAFAENPFKNSLAR